MRFPFLLPLPVVAFFFASASPVRADNASDAIDELRQGYALKKEGNCRDALPHFVRSFQLDAKPKALLNRADCEAQTGDLVAAQGHAAQGLQLARQTNDAELSSVAEAQLGGVEAKLPHLTIKLGLGAPAGSKISRDGVPVDTSLLGVAAALNPGKHKLVVTAQGYADRTFEVTLVEGANESIEVQPGARRGAKSDEAKATPQPPGPTEVTAEPAPTTETWPRTPLLYTALGVGGVGLVLGVTAGLVANGKHSTLQGECDNGAGTCGPQYSGDLDAFHTWRTVSTVAYVVGALGVAGGAVLWFTAPKAPSTTAHLWLGPASAGVSGTF
jgi:hypothetical protein